MRAERFVRNLKYDAVPRTAVLIEQFIREVYASFDTMHGAESHYANCTGCAVMTLKGFQLTVRRPCRTEPEDS